MNDLESVIQEIVRLHLDPEGFLVKLRAATFDEERYQQCVTATKRYIALTRESTMVDKRVARFVLDMVDYMGMLTTSFHQHQLPIAKRTGDAFINFRQLADEVLLIDGKA
jgi:hypothetical protein